MVMLPRRKHRQNNQILRTAAKQNRFCPLSLSIEQKNLKTKEQHKGKKLGLLQHTGIKVGL